jgi:hypothetical protein
MPSLHVGWALLISVVVIRTTTPRWKWLTLVHPAITTLVVVVTANHYWLDALAAAALLAVTLLITPRPRLRSPEADLPRQRQHGEQAAAVEPVTVTAPAAG